MHSDKSRILGHVETPIRKPAYRLSEKNMTEFNSYLQPNETFEKCFPPSAGFEFKAIPQESGIGQP